MNRRNFLKRFGQVAAGATAAVVVAPAIIEHCNDPWCGSIAGEGIIPHDELHDSWDGPAEPILRNYADYTNFSEFALKESIDKTVQQAVEQLGRAHALRIERLIHG